MWVEILMLYRKRANRFEGKREEEAETKFYFFRSWDKKRLKPTTKFNWQ